jgi:N-dimethylarginine dimethylaminohydrolase
MPHDAPTFLMCEPRHFAVSYRINPWMDPAAWRERHAALASAALAQWTLLCETLASLGARVHLVPPVPALPDLVFTANAAVVLDGTALRHPERQAEEPVFARAFAKLQADGLLREVRTLPASLVLEGAGDCVFDAARTLFWLGYGPRSDQSAQRVVEDVFGVPAVALELADPRFYHMDTALRPLPGGEVVYFPGAFTPAGRARIHDLVDARQRIEIAADDALLLAANAVCIGSTIVSSGASESLRARLQACGYRLMTLPLSAFLRSGGGAFCLTLRLDQVSAGTAQEARRRSTQARPLEPAF